MVSRQSAQEFVFRRSTDAAQQLREDPRRRPNRALHQLDPLAGTARPRLVHEDGGIKDDEFTHRALKI